MMLFREWRYFFRTVLRADFLDERRLFFLREFFGESSIAVSIASWAAS